MALSSSDQAFKRIQPEEFFQQHFESGVRPDGRESLTGLRPVSISVGSLTTADGSSIVRQGQTTVACGVKLELAEPRTETPNEGDD
jgi:exosome complex component RRP43